MSAGFLLDTNIVSELTRPRVEPKVQAGIAAQEFGSLQISVVKPRRNGEGLYGDERSSETDAAGSLA
jgi:predicted nucleic acid-binding protein